MNDRLPQKYRNRIFRWRGGGYDGCFWEPNLGYSDKDGNYHPVISTGCEAIDDIPTLRRAIGQRLWVDKYGESFNRGYLFNSKEIQIEPLTQEGFDAVCACTRTDYMAYLADKLNENEDAGIEMVCSRCGRHFHSYDYSFRDIIGIMTDSGYCRGDGGIGIITNDCWCDECRQSYECENCHNIDDSMCDYDNLTFRNRIICEWLHVCDNCADWFYHESVGSELKDEIGELESFLDEDAAKIGKYCDTLREGGTSEEEINRIRTDAETRHEKIRKEMVNKMIDKLEPLAKEHFAVEVRDLLTNRL